MGWWSNIVAEKFLKWLSPENGLRWLDVGCGSGALSESIIRGYCPKSVTAVDQSEEFIKTAQKRLESNVNCKLGDALNLPVEENTIDAAVEKHIPVINKIDGGYRVIVGEINHPMIEKHYIEWIELVADNQVFRRYLKPEEPPESIFHTSATDVLARGYCNLHGHWKSN